ncbi:MAG: HAD-IA family hydrolase [Pseudomonadota bacterium]
MAPIDLIIFDCDGVLVDSEMIAAKVEAEMFNAWGYEIDWQDFAARFAGMTTESILQTVADEMERPVEASVYDDIQTEIEERLTNELEMIRGVDLALDKLETPRCICSNSSDERLAMMLRKVGLLDRFKPYIFSSRSVGDKEPKPSPSVFKFALSEFGAEGRNAVVIEDSHHGVAGARAAGCRVVGFTGAGHTYPGHAEQLMDAGAETVIAKMSDLPATLDAMAQWDGMGDGDI